MDTIEKIVNRQMQARVAASASRVMRGVRSSALAVEVDAVCRARQVRRPGGYLAEIMSGVDPRAGAGAGGRILALVEQVVQRGVEAVPTVSEWLELVELLRDRRAALAGAEVPLDTSVAAATTLARQLYPRATCDDGEVGEGGGVSAGLSEPDMLAFAEWWESRY